MEDENSFKIKLNLNHLNEQIKQNELQRLEEKSPQKKGVEQQSNNQSNQQSNEQFNEQSNEVSNQISHPQSNNEPSIHPSEEDRTIKKLKIENEPPKEELPVQKKKQNNSYYFQNTGKFSVKENYSDQFLSEEQKLRLSFESASKFNNKLLLNREQVSLYLKNIQTLKQETIRQNPTCVQVNVPFLYMNKQQVKFYEPNNQLDIGKATVEQFINLNAQNEHSTQNYSHSYTHGYRNQQNYQDNSRVVQKRRRRK